MDDAALVERLVPLFPDRMSGARFMLEALADSIAEKANAIPGGCGLIILDTLARLSEGDENASSDIRPFMDAMAKLVQATGASVLAIHHVGKGNDTPSDKKLWARLHPENLRGSSAIEAGVRFILTMAALSPAEAASAGLDESQALSGDFVALHLAKTSQVDKGKTLLLERRHEGEPGAGFLCPHPESERALAAIHGASAVLKLNLRDKVLVAIAEAGSLTKVDQNAAAKLLWPDSGKPRGQWDKHLTGLRQKGFLKDPHLTDTGWAYAETRGFRNPSIWKPHHEAEASTTQDSRGLPPGSLEMEEAEEKGGSFLPSIPTP